MNKVFYVRAHFLVVSGFQTVMVYVAWKNHIFFSLAKWKALLSCRESQSVVGKGMK